MPNKQTKTATSDAPNKELGYIKPRQIVEEMQESYLDYAMTVIVSRALPDVRDGLKPVHRRILYAMHSMGLRHNVKFRKSATVVGECFVKDTMILTKKGLLPIQDVRSGDKVYTQIGVREVTQLYEMPKRPLMKIQLQNGVSNVVTLSQKIKVLTPDWKFIWKEAKNLTKDDYVVVKADYPDITSLSKLKTVIQNEPQYLNERLAYFLGLFVSEGSISNDYGKKKLPRICIHNHDENIMKRAASILEQEFAYRPRIEVRNYMYKGVSKKQYCIRINRKQINKFFVRNFDLEGKWALTKDIPKQIFTSPKAIIFSFISGLIDGDGSIHKRRRVIFYGSISKNLIDRLQILLQQVGIFSSQYEQKHSKDHYIGERKVINSHPLYALEITGIMAVRLAKLLTLSDERKKIRAQLCVDNEYNKRNCGFKFDIIPYAGQMIFQELSRKHIGSGWYKDVEGQKFRMGIKHRAGCKIRYSSDLWQKPLRTTQVVDWGIKDKLDKIGSPMFNFLQHVIENKIYFLRVADIVKVKPEKTYDFQVEGEHEFIANGMISHNCLGKYHPHGDMAVYDAMVRMAQDFSLRYPLVKGQGNFGSIDGDNSAASRYTEAKLSRIGEDILMDIEKDTVNFMPNYDGTRTEPIVLPSPMPQLLLNGSLGIAVGMATNIPPHNVSEILDATIYLIDHPKADTEDLFQFVKGPDFPTGGIIYNKKEIITAYSQGKGPVLSRGKAEIKEQKKGNFHIIISEIPYQVQKSTLVQQFAKLVEAKKVDGIKDIRDESDREGMRIVIELKKDAFPKKVLNALYKYTDLQKTFNLNMMAIVDGIQPKVLSLVDVLNYYLIHKKDVVIRRTKFDLKKAKEKAHVLDGLMIALKKIDQVIQTIKKSESKEKAHVNLRKKFKLSAIQATAILEMRLQSLAKLERDKIKEELDELKKFIQKLNAILKSPKKIKDVMKKELLEMKEKYGDERKTKVVIGGIGDIAEEDLIAKENVIITLTQSGYIKRMKPDSYKAQKRGGTGMMGIDIKEEDGVEHFLAANTLDKLLFFADSGKVFQSLVWEIPEMSRVSKGRGLLNFLEISPNEKIQNLIPNNKELAGENSYLVMVTKNGIIKKTNLSLFDKVRKSGLIAIKLQKGDHLKTAKIVKKSEEIILVTKLGKSIRFKEKDIRPMGRSAAGVKGIRLSGEDEVIGMSIVESQTPKPKEQKYLLIITENGYGKRTKVGEYRLQKRGGSGIKAARINEKTGRIVYSKGVGTETNDLIVISNKGQVIKTTLSSISIIGRASSGVRVMKLKPGDKVASAICL